MNGPERCSWPDTAWLNWHSDDPKDRRMARDICQGCTVKQACYDGAIERGERYGVWGGEVFGRGGIPVTGPTSAVSLSQKRTAA